MKYTNPYVNIPYLGMNDDGETTYNWAKFRFTGLVDHRRIKRMVRRKMYELIERRIDTDELLKLVNWRRITHAESITEGSAAATPKPADAAV